MSITAIKQFAAKAAAQPMVTEANPSVDMLITSHMKLVMSMVRSYNSSKWYEDIVAEGIYALVRAAHTYDRDRMNTFATYAIPHIRYAIMSAWLTIKFPIPILSNNQIRKAYHHISKYRVDDDRLTDEQAISMATDLDIEVSHIRELEDRLVSSAVVSLNPDGVDESEAHNLTDSSLEPTVVLTTLEYETGVTSAVSAAISRLSDRERMIITSRWLPDEGASVPTLKQLSEIIGGVSIERTRQIESAAMSKMKKVLEQNQMWTELSSMLN